MPRADLPTYRSGFWATVPLPARDRPGAIEIEAAVRLAGAGELTAPLGRVEVVEPEEPPAHGSAAIAVCMATFEPEMSLFRTQIESLKAQTETDWICVVSDDCSAPDRFEAIEAAVAGDPRFVVSRSPERLGFYRNFERALRMAPRGAELVALCDQDDRWFPEKLERLRAGLGDAVLVYSDQRLVDSEGRVLQPTLWKGRRNNHTNLASLLVANSLTGAAALFRRDLLDLALPFPDTPGLQFHDHWIALVALAAGRVAYLDQPLYDYVQHAGAVFGEMSSEEPLRRRLPRPRGLMQRWRAAYFYGYLGREVQAQVLLARCAGRLDRGKRRALERFASAERSLSAVAWLALRPLRAIVGRNETLGSELDLVRGLLWRRIVVLRAWLPGRRADARFPHAGPESFEQIRLRRWRARLHR
jgi:glycosyltransferase involved in cell wall biosynthesis